MTDINKTLITVVLDRSGSMQKIDADTCVGFNAFIKAQREVPGECLVTLVRFDDPGMDVVDYMDKPIAEVPELKTVAPRGWTALHDAIGKTIDNLGTRLHGLSEEQRPGKVVFVIITDGDENRSRSFDAAKVKAMIEHQRHVYNWQFVFLGANQDAVQNAANIGISKALAADYRGENSSRAFMATSSNLRGYRSSLCADAQVMAFSAEQRDDLVAGDHHKLDLGGFLGQPHIIPADPIAAGQRIFHDPTQPERTVGEMIDWFKTQGDLKTAGDLTALVTAGKIKMEDTATGRAFTIPGMSIGNANAVAKATIATQP